MILSDRTLSILKACGQLNPRILLRKGSVIKTKNDWDILIADIDEHIPVHCSIENLPDFLKKINQMKNPDLTFHADHIEMKRGLVKAKFFPTPDLTSQCTNFKITSDSYNEFFEIKGQMEKERIEKEFSHNPFIKKFGERGSLFFYRFHVDMNKPFEKFYLYRDRILDMFKFCSDYQGGHWAFSSCLKSNSIYFKYGYACINYEYLTFYDELYSLKVGSNANRGTVCFVDRDSLKIPLSISFVPYWDVHIYPSKIYLINREGSEIETEGPLVLSLNSKENGIQYFTCIPFGAWSRSNCKHN